MNNQWCSHTDDVAEGESGYFVRCMKSEDAPPGWARVKSKATQGGATFAPEGAAPMGDEGRAKVEKEQKKAKKKSVEQMMRARELFAQARPLGESERGMAYFASRGVALPADAFPALRFDPACQYTPDDATRDHYDRKHKNKGRTWPVENGRPASRPYPAVVCGATDPNGTRVSAVQRLYLHPGDGARGKLPVLRPKKALGSISEGSVKIGRAADPAGVDVHGETLVLCEGVETALALRMATGLTVWACVSTSGLRKVELPDGRRPARIIIAADHDAWSPREKMYPGLGAAVACAKRLELYCADVRIALPPAPAGVELGRGRGQTKSVDWLDLFNHADYGAEAVDRLVREGGKTREEINAPPPPGEGDGGAGGGDGETAAGGGWEDDGRYVDRRHVWVKANDPIDQAEQLLRTPNPPDHALTYIGQRREPLLRRWAEVWWKYDGSRYERMRDEKMRSIAQKFLRQTKKATKQGENGDWEYAPYGTSMTRAASLLSHLVSVTELGGDGPEPSEMPLWITPEGRIDRKMPDPRDCIAFENGILDVAAWCRGEKKMLPPSPGWFSATCLPYALPDEAHPSRPELPWERAPVYRKFIGETFAENTGRDLEDLHGLEQIDYWHEWAGYLMVPDYSVQQICGIQGPAGSGKGTLLRLALQLYGEDQVASTSLSDLGEKYGLEPLLGKLVVVDSDAESAGPQQAREGVARLKKISGHDAVQVRRMGQPNIPSVKLPGRFTIVCNEVPWMPDGGGALRRRFFWLTTPHPVPPESVDRNLDAKLGDELPWVAVHALDGLARLRRRVAEGGGAFSTPAAAIEVEEMFLDSGNHVATFVRDCLLQFIEGREKKGDVYAAYRHWCEEQQIEHPKAPNIFSKQLKPVAPWITSEREGKPGEDGKRHRCYVGVKIADGCHAPADSASF